MAVMLDADVIIRGEKGKFDLAGWFESQPEEQFQVAAVTVAELWHGVERASSLQRMQRERYLRAILETLPIVTYDAETAYFHARIWAALEAAGKMTGPYDLILAASALRQGSAVATFNLTHFSEVPGLRVIVPQ